MANTDFEWVASGLLLYPLKTANGMGNYLIANFVYFTIFHWKMGTTNHLLPRY